MTSYFTTAEARAARQRRFGQRPSMEVLNESASAKSATGFDVFLSHSSKDADLVLGTMALLEDQGLKVYVDWVIDPQLDRSRVSPETARLLRERMGQCSSLVYMATSSAVMSKWMPWELGYFDGRKGEDKIAILPILERQHDGFAGQEYIGLYSVLRKHTMTDGIERVLVEDVGNRWKFAFALPLNDGWRRYGA
ncbi:toll/interleukin-1 receptor domain-containing protein [Luteibacter aegosomatis]|uniref:toll/interleukin-1 receptor domain-containing protein n=1 Tax=Luteibacter aegosomatis TaxID=2911537 RepID=UPI001FF9F518|nr:toll/interleukin-1 receptor domain-containing protein [Luteibacter aegosomatis]UPG87590.1 toll/interleukin-1 receptor domain-containing protein [Luteibacter aegosomatis]